jgi:hypothetical protein
MTNHINNPIIFAFLVLTLIVSTIILSVTAHEGVHLIQVMSLPNSSANDIEQVCVAGWQRERPTANGWVFYERNSMTDPEHLPETPAYVIQGIVGCICLLLSGKVLYTYMKGGNNNER